MKNFVHWAFYEGDVAGLQIGSLDKEIQKVMVTLMPAGEYETVIRKKVWDLIIANMSNFRPVKDLCSPDIYGPG